MKKLMLTLCLVLSSFNIWACSCSKYVLSHDTAIEQFVKNEFGRRAKIDLDQDVVLIKAYPSLIEKMDLFKFKGTSCEVRGPQDEFLYHCINKVKYDYLIKLNNCEVVLRVKSTYSKVSSRLISKTCMDSSNLL